MKKTVYFIGKVSEFISENAVEDRRHEMPVIVVPLAGDTPRRRNVIAGTVAKNDGLEIGKSYYFVADYQGKAESRRTGEMVDSWNYTSICELKGKELIDMIDQLGPKVIQSKDAIDEERDAAALTGGVTQKDETGELAGALASEDREEDLDNRA